MRLIHRVWIIAGSLLVLGIGMILFVGVYHKVTSPIAVHAPPDFEDYPVLAQLRERSLDTAPTMWPFTFEWKPYGVSPYRDSVVLRDCDSDKLLGEFPASLDLKLRGDPRRPGTYVIDVGDDAFLIRLPAWRSHSGFRNVDAARIVYPQGYVLPEYDGERFQWIGENAALSVDGSLFEYDTREVDNEYHELPALKNALQFVGGVRHKQRTACALWRNGTVRCWHTDHEIPLASQATERDVVALPTATSKLLNNCALLADGSVYCWANSPRQPVRIPAAPARDLQAGSRICILTVDGRLACGPHETTSNGVVSPQPVVDVPSRSDLQSIHFYGAYSLTLGGASLTTKGEVLTWGVNGIGQLGDGTTEDRIISNPFRIPRLGRVRQVIPGGCALTEVGTVYCWGAYRYQFRQAMDESAGFVPPLLPTSEGSIPEPVPGIVGAIQLGTMGGLVCARIEDGRVYCWGRHKPKGTDLGGDPREFVPPVPLHATRARFPVHAGPQLPADLGH